MCQSRLGDFCQWESGVLGREKEGGKTMSPDCRHVMVGDPRGETTVCGVETTYSHPCNDHILGETGTDRNALILVVTRTATTPRGDRNHGETGICMVVRLLIWYAERSDCGAHED